MSKYLTWNSRLTFMKKTNMPQLVKSLGYTKCYSPGSPRPVKSSSNSIRYNCQKICSWSRRPKTILEIRTKATFFQVINNPIIYKFFKDFTNPRMNTSRVVVFSCRPFPNILKYREGPLMNSSNNLEIKTPSDTYWIVQLVCKKVQDQMPLTNLGSIWPF